MHVAAPRMKIAKTCSICRTVLSHFTWRHKGAGVASAELVPLVEKMSGQKLPGKYCRYSPKMFSPLSPMSMTLYAIYGFPAQHSHRRKYGKVRAWVPSCYAADKQSTIAPLPENQSNSAA
jgi:hypothetical protein